MMDTLALDLNSLLAEINYDKEERNNVKAFPTGARIGHIHLRVTNLERSIKFYHEKIGLDITVNWLSMGAAISFCRRVRSSHWHEYLAQFERRDSLEWRGRIRIFYNNNPRQVIC